MLDRDELAARCLVVMMSNSASRGRPDEFASDAVTFSDALLARLAETAPAPAAPVPAPVAPSANPWTWRPKPEIGDVWVHPLAPETHVIITNPNGGLTLSAVKNLSKGDRVVVGAASKDGDFGWYFLRPATDAERVAAGLPPIAPTAPASREAVARALREAYQSPVFGGTQVSWESVPEESRNGYLAEADAALALLCPGARWPEAKS